MYTILVVDDESLIREGVKDIVSQIEGFSVQTAANGKEALSLAERTSFDGMIIDVRMPKMSGLEFIEALAASNDSSIKFILSGHDEFSYVRQAMQQGVSDYILKPLIPEDVRALALKMKGLIDDERTKRREEETLRQVVSDSMPLLSERFFHDVLSGCLSEESFKKKVDFFEFTLPHRFFAVLTISVESFGRDLRLGSEEAVQLKLMGIERIMRETLPKFCSGFLFRDTGDSFCAVLNLPGEENSGTLFDRFFEEVSKLSGQSFHCRLYAGAGTVLPGHEGIQRSYREAKTALSYAVAFSYSEIVHITDVEERGGSRGNHTAHLAGEQFAILLKTGKRQEALTAIDSSFAALHAEKDRVRLMELHLLASKFLTLTLESLLESGQTGIGDFPADPYGELFALKGMNEMKHWLKNFISQAVRKIEAGRKEKGCSAIEKAKDIIERNYERDISLSWIAGKLSLSPNYFGHLFKETVGVSVIDYILEIRIGRAKELLRNTEMKVYEVAAAAGFNDQRYFSLIFKKRSGLTPKEYRDLP